MTEETFSAIPEHLRDEMKIKSIEAANFKEIYKKDVLWNTANENMIHWLKVKQEQEARIRIENR